MFPSLLFCSCLVAFSSAGLVSTNSQVDYTTYGNLLALLSGNTALASPDRVPYLRRLPQHQGKDGTVAITDSYRSYFIYQATITKILDNIFLKIEINKKSSSRFA
jgi:hypothetical protein